MAFDPSTPDRAGSTVPQAPPRRQMALPSGATHQDTRRARTSRLESPASEIIPIHPSCNGRKYFPLCRSLHAHKRHDQTKGDAGIEPRGGQSCGRSQTLLYNGRRPHQSLDDATPDQAYFNQPPVRLAAQPRQTLHLSTRRFCSDKRVQLSSHRLPLRDGRHHFFELRSFNMALSSIASASSFFSLAFSSVRTFSRRASDTSSPPYFAFHL